MIPGIDVSHWQDNIDWAEVKRSGVKFAFIKATEFPDKKTSLFIDNTLQINIRGAAENNIHWGAYHFFRTHIDPVIQAQVFCETVGEFNSLPPVMDLEAAGSKGERLNHKVRQFLEEVVRITGRTPIIYTSGGFWRSYMMYEKLNHTDWAGNYPLWLAHYTNLWPSPLYPWAAWDFWQYSDHGRIPGINTHVDLNWFNGSESELIEKFVNQKLSLENSISNDEQLMVHEPAAQSKSLDSHYKGDYQESDQMKQSQNLYASKYSANQEEWIRSYFFGN